MTPTGQVPTGQVKSRREALGLALPLALALLLASAGAGCSKPKPPQLTPRSAKVTKLDLAGVDLRVEMEAFNPNGFDLAVRRVTGHVVIDGKYDLGTVAVDQPITLPAGARTNLDVPLSVKWNGAQTFAAIGAARRAVPYTVDGTATIGGERFNVDVPFTLKGEITEEQVVSAALRSLQNLPGLFPPPAPK